MERQYKILVKELYSLWLWGLCWTDEDQADLLYADSENKLFPMISSVYITLYTKSYIFNLGLRVTSYYDISDSDIMDISNYKRICVKSQ